MPHYTHVNTLPDLSFRTPIGKQVYVCETCIRKHYSYAPESMTRNTLANCHKCGKCTSCSPYEQRRLVAIPPKPKAIPIAQKFNIVRRKK